MGGCIEKSWCPLTHKLHTKHIINCACGSDYQSANKNKHEQKKKHLEYIELENEFNAKFNNIKL